MPELRVLVALDGSDKSEAALRFLPLLRPLGAMSVRLLAVVETYSESEGLKGAEEFVEREGKLLRAYLDKTAADLRSRLGVGVDVELRAGAPDDEISAAAHAAAVNLILLTTHGRSGIGRWTIGSVADKVVRHAEQATLVIGPEAEKRGPGETIREVLLPLDGSDLSEEAIGAASSWAAALGARLHIVRVVTIPPTSVDAAGSTFGPDLLEGMREAAEIYLERMRSAISGVEVVTDTPVGPIADALLTYEDDHNIDLVVMTSHARRGLLRSLLGSVSDRVMHGRAPVLIVRQS